MSCCNQNNNCGKVEKCQNKCHDSYKTIECYECNCHKKNICQHHNPSGFNGAQQMGEYNND